jgi:hypothetical protein
MTRYDNVLDAIGGTAFAKLVRVLLAVHELTDFSGGQQWLAIPLVADFREQVESLLIPDEASYFGANDTASGQYHGGLHAGYCVYCPISTP